MRKFLLALSYFLVAVTSATPQSATGPVVTGPLLDDRKLQNIPDVLRDRIRKSIDGLTHPAFRQRGCTFFEHANFKGKSKRYIARVPVDIGKNGTVRAHRDTINYVGDDMNDRISSIRCDDKCGGWAAIHANMSGQMVPFVDPMPDLSKVGDGRYNDQLSSLELICW